MNAQTQVSMPPTDILECEDGFHIYMDLPGIAAEDLVIDLEQNELTVQASSKYDMGEPQAMRNEFGPLSYKRVFTLSDMVDRENIKAIIKDGVLDLFLPKADSMKPRRIEIKAE
ncbi:MAG: Hsp20/alpha crystallin family protein [Deltaproteobacteria bacterium]|nr:Hsp20/alpha crystallin family protein [Deltaproteobacteria bacterium]